MTPADIRDSNWTAIREHLSGRIAEVYTAWIIHGPATTRQLAQKSGIDILNVRPRTTDLVDIGLVEFVDTQNGEGIYRARRQDEWDAWAAFQRSAPVTQLNLI
ncbi:MAG: hypothetical protein LLG03_12720 [Planctomycetaceae bacterium]|nr:hypothetical protein [Planctomycetaceae bacterium]